MAAARPVPEKFRLPPRGFLLPRHADHFILAKRGFVFEPQALGPLPREVALETPVQGRRVSHRKDRTETGQRHVLVRIPLIAPRTEIPPLTEVPAKHRAR